MDKELLHTYFRGEATPEEEKQIMDWAESSPENYQEYLKERKIWNAILMYSVNPTIKPQLPTNACSFPYTNMLPSPSSLLEWGSIPYIIGMCRAISCLICPPWTFPNRCCYRTIKNISR